MGTDIMAKIDSHLPERVSELIASSSAKASDFLAACLAFIMQFFSSIPPFLSRHASAINGHARTHVYPVLQPHIERISSETKTRLAPAAAWTEKNVAPTYIDLQNQFQEQTDGYSHLQIAAVAGLGCLFVYWLLSKVISWLISEPEEPASQRRATFLRSLPGVRGIVERERAKQIATFRGEVASREVEKINYLMEVPLAGLDADSVMQELEDRAGNDFRYADGESKASGTIYMAGDVHRELLNDAYCMFSQANPLHTDLFPSIRRMEAEVVAMTASLLGGGHQGVREVQLLSSFPATA